MPDSDREEKEKPEPKQPCAFFLKTGSCAFGDQCKFEHPADQPPPQYNSLGLPLRPGEPECAYYAKNLHCGYGASCKFHHSEPALSWVPVPLMENYAVRGGPGFPPVSPYSQIEGAVAANPRGYAMSQGRDQMRMSSQPMIRGQSYSSSQSHGSGQSYAQTYPQSFHQAYGSPQPYGMAFPPQTSLSAYSSSMHIRPLALPGRLQSPLYQQPQSVHSMMQPRYPLPRISPPGVDASSLSQQLGSQLNISSGSSGYFQRPSSAPFQTTEGLAQQPSAPGSRPLRTTTASGGPSRARLDRNRPEKS